MGTFFAYSIQSAICLAAFYLFYKVLLSRETFHRFNRIALLGILISSFLIPFVLMLFPLQQKQATISETTFLIEDFPISDHAGIMEGISNNETGSFILPLLLIIYLSGCALFIAYSILSISRIIYLINKGKCIKRNNGTKLIILDDKSITPFSWMKHIVLSKSDFEEAGDTILAHESAHIRLNHTYDLLIAQICILTQWFNPAAWLLYQELQNIHEYEADEEVIRKGINPKQYQLLLIKKAVGTRLYSMANSFNHSNLKKRITMMLQKKSKPWARLKYAYVLPLAVTTVAVFAHPEISQSFKEISSAKISHFALETSTNEVKNAAETEFPKTTNFKSAEDTTVYITVDKNPEFPGGGMALHKYVSNNMRYPEIAKKNKKEGLVGCTFIVEKDGTLSNIQVEMSVYPALDEEALRIVKTFPKFIPGEKNEKKVRVKYAAPIGFSLSELSPPTREEKEEYQAPTGPKTDPSDPTLYLTAEYMPEFPGGEVALLIYVSKQLKYPENAVKRGVEGRVSCTFVVEKDGSVSNAKVTKPVDPDLDQEALRVIMALPKFTPGTIDGKAVRVLYSLPIRFRSPPRPTD